MKHYRLIVSAVMFVAIALLAAVVYAAPAESAPLAAVGEPAPNFTLADTHGNEVSLADFDGKYVVLEWLNYDCPFVRKHYSSGNMQQLQQQYTDKGVVWLAVVSSAPGKQGYFPPDEMNARTAKEHGQATAVLVDSDGTVGRLYGAKTTPHMFIRNPEGTLIYMGGIDDKPSTNTRDIEGATNFVAQALDQAMAGQPVSQPHTQSYGCSVKY